MIRRDANLHLRQKSEKYAPKGCSNISPHLFPPSPRPPHGTHLPPVLATIVARDNSKRHNAILIVGGYSLGLHPMPPTCDPHNLCK